MPRPLAVNDPNASSSSRRSRHDRSRQSAQKPEQLLLSPPRTPSPVIQDTFPLLFGSPYLVADGDLILGAKLDVNIPRVLPHHIGQMTVDRLAYLDTRAMYRHPEDYIFDIQSKYQEYAAGIACLYDPKSFGAIPYPPPNAPLPQVMTVPFSRAAGILPTHMLLVIDNTDQGAFLTPIHIHVYAYQLCYMDLSCGYLERPSPEPMRTGNGMVLPLQFLKIKVPHFPSFEYLHNWLYSYDDKALMRSLLPVMPPRHPSIDDVSRTAERLALQGDGRSLVAMLHNIHGLWQNINFMGLQDGKVWQVVDLAWAVAVEAVAWYKRSVQSKYPLA